MNLIPMGTSRSQTKERKGGVPAEIAVTNIKIEFLIVAGELLMIAPTDRRVPVLTTVAVTDEENTVMLSIGAGIESETIEIEIIETETIETVVN